MKLILLKGFIFKLTFSDISKLDSISQTDINSINKETISKSFGFGQNDSVSAKFVQEVLIFCSSDRKITSKDIIDFAAKAQLNLRKNNENILDSNGFLHDRQLYQFKRLSIDNNFEIYLIDPKDAIVTSRWCDKEKWEQLKQYRLKPEVQSYHNFQAFKKNSYFRNNRDAISLILFSDDFTCQTRKYFNITYWIGELPLKTRFSESNTHLLCLLDRNLLKDFIKKNPKKGFQYVLEKIIDFLLVYTNGIEIPNFGLFKLCPFSIIADNLGVHELLNYSCSFNSCNRICFRCMEPKNMKKLDDWTNMKIIYPLKNSRQFYNDSIKMDKLLKFGKMKAFTKLKKMTGLCGISNLFKIPAFSLEQVSRSVMHDYLEGSLNTAITDFIRSLKSHFKSKDLIDSFSQPINSILSRQGHLKKLKWDKLLTNINKKRIHSQKLRNLALSSNQCLIFGNLLPWFIYKDGFINDELKKEFQNFLSFLDLSNKNFGKENHFEIKESLEKAQNYQDSSFKGHTKKHELFLYEQLGPPMNECAGEARQQFYKRFIPKKSRNGCISLIQNIVENLQDSQKKIQFETEVKCRFYSSYLISNQMLKKCLIETLLKKCLHISINNVVIQECDWLEFEYGKLGQVNSIYCYNNLEFYFEMSSWKVSQNLICGYYQAIKQDLDIVEILNGSDLKRYLCIEKYNFKENFKSQDLFLIVYSINLPKI